MSACSRDGYYERRFRPLAGINCNLLKVNKFHDYYTFPSPCGDKLQLDTRNEDDCIIRSFRPLAGNSLDIKKHGQTTDGFRPLAGCSFTIPHIESKEKNYTLEKHGWSRKDKS